MTFKNLIIVKARITMLATEEGGRKSGFVTGYKPNHVFEWPQKEGTLQTHVGDIQFDDQKLFEPGETKIVTVRFLHTPFIVPYINVGQKWFINESHRTLGSGEILEILHFHQPCS